MDIHLDASVIQDFVVLIAVLTTSAALGVKRGWRGQLVAFVPILAMWLLFSAMEDTLIKLLNGVYRGFLFSSSSCAVEADSLACLESTDVTLALLVNPDSPNETRLFFLSILVLTVVLAYLFVWRFGRVPSSLRQKLMGGIIGIANGFTLSYLLLPLWPYRQETSLPLAEAMVQEDFPQIAEGLRQFAIWPHFSAPVVVLIGIVVFVIVAVRFIRPTKGQLS